MSKVLLINTFYPRNIQMEKYSHLSPPLGLLTVSSALRKKGYDTIFIDPRMDDNYYDKIQQYIQEGVIFIGMSAYMGSNLLNAQELCQQIKRIAPHVPIVWGGPLATSSPEVCFANAPVDYIVLGMGEETIIKLADRLDNHEDASSLPHVISREHKDISQKSIYYFEGDLDKLEFPDLTQWTEGLIKTATIPIISSRGCPRNCAFCYNNTFSGRRKWYARSSKHVLQEMGHWADVFGLRSFYFVDDNFLVNTRRACTILDEAKDSDYTITQILGHMDDYKTEIVDRIGDDIQTVHFAIESVSPKIQKLLNKPINRDRAIELFTLFTKKRITNINTNFMFGFPTEDYNDIRDNLTMAANIRNINPKIRMIPYIYTPQPKDDIIPNFGEYYQKIEFTFENLATIDYAPNRNRYLAPGIRPWMSKDDINFYLDFVLAWFYHFDYVVREDQGIDIEEIYTKNERIFDLFKDIQLPGKVN